jgi:hypothetical protein
MAVVGVLALTAGTTARADSSYQSAVLGDGPLSYYRFSESGVTTTPYPIATNYGSLGASANATVVAAGSPAGFPIPCGQAGPMTGSGSYFVPTAFADQATNYPYLNIPYQSALAISGPFSVEFWAKPGHTNDYDSFSTPVMFANWNASAGGRCGWAINQCDTSQNFGNGWYFAGYKGGGSTTRAWTCSVTYNMDSSQWYHVVCVYDGSTGYVYVNGALLVSAASSGGYTPCNNNYPLTLGSRGNNNNPLKYPWKGNMSEFAFYGSALSAGDVAAHYSCATTNPTYYPTLVGNSSPLVYLRLNEAWSATTAANSSSAGSSLDGEYRYYSTTTNDLQAPTYPGLETTNRVLAFDTSVAGGGYVLTPAPNVTATGGTFECLLKRNGDQPAWTGLVFTRNDPSSSCGLGFSGNQINSLSYSWNNGYNNFDSELYPPDGQWVYAAVTVNSANATICMYDGTTWSTAVDASAHASANFNGQFMLGNDPATTGRFYNGLMDEAAVYNQALSEGQLHSHALVAFGGAGAPVFVYDPPVATPSAMVMSGTTFTLKSDAYGAPPLAFQWRHAGTNLAGATTTSYTKSNVTLRDAGNYDLVVTNASGSITGSPLAMTILDLPANATNDLRLLLKFDESTGLVAANSSTNLGVSGVLNGFPDGNAQWVQGAIVRALRVNPPGSPSSEYVDVSDSNGTLEFSSSQEFSLSAWVKAGPSQASGAGVIAKGEGAGGEQFALDVNNGAYRFYVRDGSGNAAVFQTSVAPNNNWQHIAAVFSVPLGLVNIYINGVQVLSGIPPSSLMYSAHDVTIGARQSGYGDYDLPLNGTIDDVRIYARMLSQGDVTLLYTNALPIRVLIDQQPQPASRSVLPGGSVAFSAIVSGSPIAYQWQHAGVNVAAGTTATLVVDNVDGTKTGDYTLIASNSLNSVTSSPPVSVSLIPLAPASYAAAVVADLPEAFWRLDETAAGTAWDSMGRHDGTSQSSIAFSQPGALAGDTDTCMGFDGSSSRVQVPYSAALNATSFSVECWAQFTGSTPISGGNYYTPIASVDWEDSNARGFILYATPNTQWENWIAQGGASWSITPGATIIPSAWAHVVGTCGGGTSRIYVNGVLAHEQAATMSPNPSLPFGIGYNPQTGAYYFLGSIDEVAYYRSVLSADRVSAHYQLGVYGTNDRPIFVVGPASQTVVAGTTVSFSTTLAGASPMAKQWKLNGADIPSANGLTLSFAADYTDAGQYTLAATNGFGGAVSSAATLVVMPPASVTNLTSRISTTPAGPKLELIWPFGHTLYYATDLTSGSWLPVSDASAPYYNVPISPATPKMFYKIQ